MVTGIGLENTFMKWCLYLLLLAGPVAAHGQQRPGLFDAIPKWHPDSALVRPMPPPIISSDGGSGDWQKKWLAQQPASVQILGPDKMPCRIPDRRKVERMPISRLWNADKMPNPLKGWSSEHLLYH